MYTYSKKSRQILEKAHPYLQEVFNEVIKYMDVTILESYRDEETQNRMVAEGKSKLGWPNSKHNQNPSSAIDVAPYPIDWNDTARFYYLAGLVKGLAGLHDIRIRWGGDWDGDNSFKDQTFHDLPHFEVLRLVMIGDVLKWE